MIMNTRQNRLIIFALLLLTQTPLGAQLHSTKIELPEDSISATMEDSVPAKRSFFKKFLDYFNDANKEKKNKKFDFSVIGGPHYSSVRTRTGGSRTISHRSERCASSSLQCLSLRRCVDCRLLPVGSPWEPSVSARQMPLEL